MGSKRGGDGRSGAAASCIHLGARETFEGLEAAMPYLQASYIAFRVQYTEGCPHFDRPLPVREHETYLLPLREYKRRVAAEGKNER